MKRKKKSPRFNTIFYTFLTCMIFGFLGFYIADLASSCGISIDFLILLFVMFLSFYSQIIIHEAGHLLGGLLSGYHFLSFRIGNIILQKTGDRFEIRKMSLASTGGQCLMCPPKYREGYPYRLYSLGGAGLNLFCVLFSLLMLLFTDNFYLHAFFVMNSCFAFLFALTNGFPLETEGITTDGYNTVLMDRDPEAAKAMWKQLKINEMQTKGMRLRDMPEQWFEVSETADMLNPMISSITVFKESRLMDEQRFLEAKQLIRKFLDGEYHCIGIYRTFLQLDDICLDLLNDGMQADISVLNSKENKAILKQMKDDPAVLRTNYFIALLQEKDEKKAKQIEEKFLSLYDTYSNRVALDIEKDFMEVAKNKMKEQ